VVERDCARPIVIVPNRHGLILFVAAGRWSASHHSLDMFLVGRRTSHWCRANGNHRGDIAVLVALIRRRTTFRCCRHRMTLRDDGSNNPSTPGSTPSHRSSRTSSHDDDDGDAVPL